MKKEQKLQTIDEREPSACAVRTEKGKGRRTTKNGYWAGMNSRDETDPCTMKPVGRMIKEGFELLNDNDTED